MDSQPRVLVVDDTPANLLAVETVLESCGVEIVKAGSGADALRLSLDGGYALVLLDVEMPGMNGYECATLMRSSARTRDIPIIFVTGTQVERHNVFRGYESGAVDYILKPLNPTILQSKVKVFAELYRLRLEEKQRITQREKERFEDEKRLILEQENAKLRTILDNLAIGVALGEAPSGALAHVNKRLQAMSSEVFPPGTKFADGRPLMNRFEALERSLDGKTIVDEEACFLLPNGERRTLLISGTPIRGQSGAVTSAVVSFTDVSARVAAEAAREEAREKLQQAYKMSALGEMAGGIAHEVNNPLSIILGKARQLRDEINRGAGNKELLSRFVASIEETSHRIVKIVNGLRTISRSSARDPFVLSNLATIVEGTLAICAARIKHAEIQLNVEGLTPHLRIACRAAEISQVVLNLVGNSLDAVELRREKWIKIRVLESKDHVEMAFEDSGEGIPPAIREKILEPFFTTKEVGKGTGLGLSISKSIIEDHGGEFSLDTSVPYTRFIVRLPKNTAKAAS